MSELASTYAGRTVVVTGGAGFIGSHLVDALVDLGALVCVIDNLSSGSRENLKQHGDSVRLDVADITDMAACARVLEGADVVFHQAAVGSVPRSMATPNVTFDTNVLGTTNVFQAARDAGVTRVVYASSSSVYGDSQELPKREGAEGHCLSPYALSKRVNEQLAEVFSRCYGLEFVGLRYFNVYGPRQSPEGPYAAVLPRFFRAALSGEPARIFGDGEQSRDFTFVRDAVQANLLAGAAPAGACGRAYNIGASGTTTVNKLHALVNEATGKQLGPVYDPPRAGDIRHSHASIDMARAHLGYDPQTAVETGIAATAEAWGA